MPKFLINFQYILKMCPKYFEDMPKNFKKFQILKICKTIFENMPNKFKNLERAQKF